MYSPRICDKRIQDAVRQTKTRVKRLPRAESIGISAELERLRLDKNGRMLPDGQLIRELKRDEQEFILSEQLICKCDFRYFFERYGAVELDSGVAGKSGIAAPELLPSQKRFIILWGRREEQCYLEVKENGFTEGIRCFIHKVRQVAATATCAAAAVHRMTFWPSTRAFSASLDDIRRTEVYTRHLIMYQHMPFWMRPKLSAEVKGTEISLEAPINSRSSFQSENQETGIGVGTQNDISHLTEVGLWENPGSINFSFLPSLPKSISTLHNQESTANGKGNYWHEVTEYCRKGKRGYESWVYAFIPWYLNTTKWRAIAPPNWIPTDHTIKHAALIERTSHEYNDGVTVTPTREQLYWWETTRTAHVGQGELATFLTNYPATPEQSFQNPNMGALPAELIEKLELDVRPGIPYDVNVVYEGL